jgi:hypothetical protein
MEVDGRKWRQMATHAALVQYTSDCQPDVKTSRQRFRQIKGRSIVGKTSRQTSRYLNRWQAVRPFLKLSDMVSKCQDQVLPC